MNSGEDKKGLDIGPGCPLEWDQENSLSALSKEPTEKRDIKFIKIAKDFRRQEKFYAASLRSHTKTPTRWIPTERDTDSTVLVIPVKSSNQKDGGEKQIRETEKWQSEL